MRNWLELTRIYVLVLALALPPFAQAETTPNSISIRDHLTSCQALLVSSKQTDDVGLPFSTSNIEDFKRELETQVSELGSEKFRDGTFFILGVAQHKAKATQAAYDAVLRELQLDKVGAQARVMHVPSRLIAEESVSLARHVIQRLEYFFPKLKLDYQKPLMSEFSAGAVTTAMVEVPTVIFLFSTLPTVDATLTVTAHAITLTAMSLYTKSMTNWLLRKGSANGAVNNSELFVKQLLLSAPFVINFNVFGHFSDIVRYYSTHGWAQMAAAFPTEVSSFATTQGITLVLQTIFYSQVITQGFGNWMNRITNPDDVVQARSLRQWLQSPVLMLNAVVLAAASSNWGEPILTLGPAEVNWGHAALLALIAGGSGFFKYFPRAFDRILPAYKSFASRFTVR